MLLLSSSYFYFTVHSNSSIRPSSVSTNLCNSSHLSSNSSAFFMQKSAYFYFALSLISPLSRRLAISSMAFLRVELSYSKSMQSLERESSIFYRSKEWLLRMPIPSSVLEVVPMCSQVGLDPYNSLSSSIADLSKLFSSLTSGLLMQHLGGSDRPFPTCLGPTLGLFSAVGNSICLLACSSSQSQTEFSLCSSLGGCGMFISNISQRWLEWDRLIFKFKSMKQEQGVTPLRSISLSDKRDLMWNIIQPGDPYDIRKSMIAKLPGTRKFMGPHLEIVCLLQAAEIERLCAYLEEYQMKFRENQRIELDRHSYEIQIRELSERLGQEETMKSDIDKLKEFIRKQSKELEDLQRQQYNSELARRYEDSLRQIETLTAERTNAYSQLQMAQSQLQLLQTSQQDSLKDTAYRVQTERSLNEKVLFLEGERSRFTSELAFLNGNLSEKSKQIEQLEEVLRGLKLQAQKGRVEEGKRVQLAHTLQQYQNRFQIMAEEIDRLNNILREKAKEMNEQYNRYKLLLEEKTHKDELLVEYEFKIRTLEESITTLERQHRQSLVSLSTLEESKALIQSYENSLEKFSVQVDRLNTVLRKKLNQLEEAKRRNSEFEFKLKGHEATQRENNDYRSKYAEITKQMGDYEKKLNAQTQEMERLNFSIKRLIEELNYSEVKLKNAEKEIDGQQKRVAVAEAEAEREREGRSAATERAGAMLRENEELKGRLRRSEAEHVQQLNSEVSKYAQQISVLNQSLLKQSEELQYLRSSIDLSHQPRITTVTSSIHDDTQYIESLHQQIQQQNSRISALEVENHRLAQKELYGQKSTMEEGSPVRNSDNARIMAAQYEQIARISQLLKQRETEVRALNAQLQRRDQLPNMEMTHSQYLKIGGDTAGKESARSSPSDLINIEQERKMADLEQSSFLLKTELAKHGEQQSRLIQEKTVMARQMQEFKSVIGEYELRITQLMAQIQRQNSLLTDKNTQISSFEGLANEFERLKNLNSELADHYEIILAENVDNRRQLQIEGEEKKHLQTELQSKIRVLIEENYQLQQQSDGKEQTAALLGSLNNLKHDISLLQDQNRSYEAQKSQFINQNQILKTEINAIWTESNLLRTSTNQLQTDNAALIAQNAALTADNTALTSTNTALTTQINQLNIEITSLRKRVQQQSDYYGKVVLYDQEIERLNRQLQSKEQEARTIITGQQDFSLKLRTAEDSLTRATQEHQLRISSFQQKITRLTADLNSLQQALGSKEAEIDLMQRKLLQNKQQSGKLIEEVENLQSKIRLFAPEIERLNFNLKNKLEESDRLQQQNKYLTTENEDLKSRLRETPDLRSTLTTYQSKIALFSQEIERLNITLRTKIDNFNSLEAEYSRYRSESETKLLSYTRVIEEGNAKLSGLTAELQSHRAQAVQVETLSQYQAKLYELSSQIERLNRLLFSTTKQLQELQQRDSNYLTEIERLNNSLRLKVDECVRWEQIEHDLKNSLFNQQKQVLQRQEELEIINTKFVTLGKESKTQKEHLAQYELRIKQMYEEFERLQDIIKVLRKEREEQTTTQNSELAAKNRSLAEEIERLRALISQQRQEISEIRLLMVDQSTLQQSNQQQLTIIVALLAETDSLRSRLQTETSSLQQRHISEIDSYFL